MQHIKLLAEMDRVSSMYHSESEAYPLHSLFADIGGAAGLFLGLSLLGLKILTPFFTFFSHRIAASG